MKTHSSNFIPGALALLVLCTAATAQTAILGTFTCDDPKQVKTTISHDATTTQDGNGSLKVEAVQGALVTIADQQGLAVKKDHTLWCTLKVKCAGVKQKAYLEMWCEVGEGQRAFSKGLGQALQGDSDWKVIRLPMMVNGDYTVRRALVNVVIEGTGTVWVDEVQFSEMDGLSVEPPPSAAGTAAP